MAWPCTGQRGAHAATWNRHSGDAASPVLHLGQLSLQPGVLLSQQLVVRLQLHEILQQLAVAPGSACGPSSTNPLCDTLVQHARNIRGA